MKNPRNLQARDFAPGADHKPSVHGVCDALPERKSLKYFVGKHSPAFNGYDIITT